MSNINRNNYFHQILKTSDPYLKKIFDEQNYQAFIEKISYLSNVEDNNEVVKGFSSAYIKFVKKNYQNQYKKTDLKLDRFIHQDNTSIKIIWGDCLKVLKAMKPESIHVMVTSPPYYNAREYSQWPDLNKYLEDMRAIIQESYRVLDNHRVFLFNVGDIFDNDNLTTKSTWGSRRLPLGAYFIKLFEEVGFTFVDDFIWDKGEVQSERHKSGDKPYPFYQYPMNCYEHLLIFHKHRLDTNRYPCPVCGSLKVNGNTQSEIGLQSWECKNNNCFTRSKSNRGKRFSLKTILTQSKQNKRFEIPKDFIKKWRRDIVKFNPVIKINSKGQNVLGHTAPFPEEIPELAIRMFSYPGENVLDPFAGSFTSMIVAKKLGRNGIGIEINKKMFRRAILKNIDKHFPSNLFEKSNILYKEYDFY
jgi:DNA modification methylase